MATFLEMCQDVALESGTVVQPPTSVVTVSGLQAKVVHWVRKAWKDIQVDNTEWSFRRRYLNEDIAVMTAGTMAYTGASFGADDLDLWVADTDTKRMISIYDEALGKADETVISFIPWETFQTQYYRGVLASNRPQHWSVRPDTREIVFGPEPDKSYVVNAPYIVQPQILTQDADTPFIPSSYHEVIVWHALWKLALHDEALSASEDARYQYQTRLADLERDYLPEVEGGGALA